MRIQFMSDLHLEFERRYRGNGGFKMGRVDRDVLVLAGDIHLGGDALGFIMDELRYSPVVYVAGNHEFYGYDMLDVRTAWHEAARKIPDLHFLDNTSVVLNEVLFTGGTLWTDIDRENPLAKLRVGGGMSDYSVIWQKGEPFRPEHAIELHKLTKKFLMQSLEEHVGKTVVVTHMAPHELSLSKSRNINLDAAYASNLEDLIFTYQPTLWIHGHIHESRDYRVGETRIVSNPRGYFGHGPFGGENMDFDSHKVVTI